MKISVRALDRAARPADIIGIGIFEADKRAFERVFDFKKIKFMGKSGETFLVPGSPTKTKGVVLLIGLGKRENFTLEKVRCAAAKLISQAKSFWFERAELDLDTFQEKFSVGEIAAAAVEGARLSDYRFDKYKSKPSPSRKLEELKLVFKDFKKSKNAAKAVSESEAVISGIIFARDVAN